MRRSRYIIVRWPRATADNITIENGLFKNHLPIHELLHEYHGTRIDDEFVLLQGEYPIGHHNLIVDHPHALMLPSMLSGKTLHEHGKANGKDKHIKALFKKFNLDKTHTLSDLIDAMEGKVGPLLLPHR